MQYFHDMVSMVAMVVLSQRLGLMILEIFSNLSDSVICSTDDAVLPFPPHTLPGVNSISLSPEGVQGRSSVRAQCLEHQLGEEE